MSQNAEPIDNVSILTLEEEKRYWRDQTFKSRDQLRRVADLLDVAETALDTCRRKHADLEERLAALNEFERAAARTGYRTTYYLSGVLVECIRQEIAKANAYTGPRVNDYPAVIGVIGYNPASNNCAGQWLFEPDKDAVIYNGDTVIGQVLGENGHQVTPDKCRHSARHKKRRN